MSTKTNTAPNTTPTPTPATPPTTYFIHMPMAPNPSIQTVDDDRASLLGHPKYAIYNPKRVYAHAKKSKSNCCCVLFALICCFCCCFFFVTSIVLGSIIGLYATQCARDKVADNVGYTIPAFNVSNLVLHTHGDVTFTRAAANNPNITILISRSAQTQSDLDRFNSTFNAENGTVTFTDVGGDSFNFDNWWDVASFLCKSISVNIQLPSDEFFLGINLTTKNSAVTFNLGQTTQFDYLSVQSTNGAIGLDKVKVLRDLEARSTNGQINLGTVSAQTITTVSTNGHIEYGTVSASSFTAQSTNGHIEATQISLAGNGSSLDASTTNAKISLDKIIVQSPDSSTSITLQTTNSKISASLQHYLGAFDASTTNSGVSISGSEKITYTQNSQTKKEGYAGNGAGSFHASTTNSQIELEFN